MYNLLVHHHNPDSKDLLSLHADNDIASDCNGLTILHNYMSLVAVRDDILCNHSGNGIFSSFGAFGSWAVGVRRLIFAWVAQHGVFRLWFDLRDELQVDNKHQKLTKLREDVVVLQSEL